MSPRDSPHVRWCKTKGRAVADEIDEQQAEVHKLKGEVAELRVELDELKVRDRQRDEDFEKLKQDIIWVMEEVIAPRPPQVDITDPREECPGCGASRCQERFRAYRICRESVCEG